MDSKKYNLLNRVVGWSVFAIAAIVYLLTIEDSSSLWDCGEFIATSFKEEVGHPPGAPFYMLVARIATMFAPTTYYVPIMVNGMNGIFSAFTILFLFWTITHIARRIITKGGQELTTSSVVAILGSGAVGALAYTFTDTFWFSAVEGEVYSMSSFFTALVVWLMLRWEEEADSPHSARWIILIAYCMGLSIGVHILNLLTIPALVFIAYFRYTKTITIKGLIYMSAIAGAVLITLNNIIIPYTVWIGANVDTLFVNVFGLPVNSGIITFALLLFASLGFWIVWSHRKGHRLQNLIAVCITMVMIGFSSYATMTIRAAVNPPMNSNNPDNPHALLSVLNRDQYGSRPLIYGASYAAPVESYTEKSFRAYDPDSKEYKKHTTVDDYVYPDEFMHLFPRMWSYLKAERDYKPWAAYRTKMDYARDEEGNIIRDQNGKPQKMVVADYGHKVQYGTGEDKRAITEPTFWENLHFFFSYQLNYMYWRYFLWNFVGRQDDIQATDNTITNGNWLSGIDFIDNLYLGPQTNLPREMADNRGRNTYYFLPFLLGLLGLCYQLSRDGRSFTIVMWLFIMMGIALVLYFNSAPGEVRERDYVYAGSFYAFCIWIGLGVVALWDILSHYVGHKRVCAVVACVLCMGIPTLLACQNWDDHDRSGRTMARDVGYNYLESIVQKEGVSPIIINYGDNDTFPLWFNQEVDGIRTDVRIMNSSYLDGEWYVDEMKCKANDAEGVPFSLSRSKYSFVNDWLPVYEKVDRVLTGKEVIDFVASEDPRSKIDLGFGEKNDYVPVRKIAIPVNKENAIKAGIVKEQDADLMVDTVYIELKKNSISRSELMLIDLFANFDWKRPIYFTQVYTIQNLGLMDYLQFDGYSYRFVPILTPYKSAWDIGRIDADYAYDKLMNKFRYGNLADPKVYVCYFTQYNLMVSRAREAFARVAKEYIHSGNYERASQVLDRGLEVLPTSKIRFTEANTFPFIECYYALGEVEKADALLLEAANNLIEYIEYYAQFTGVQGDMVGAIMDDKLDQLSQLYYTAAYSSRDNIIETFNNYYRSIGATDDDLILTATEKDSLEKLGRKLIPHQLDKNE